MKNTCWYFRTNLTSTDDHSSLEMILTGRPWICTIGGRWVALIVLVTMPRIYPISIFLERLGMVWPNAAYASLIAGLFHLLNVYVATTANGSLVLTLEEADPADNHGLRYKSGMVNWIFSLLVLLYWIKYRWPDTIMVWYLLEGLTGNTDKCSRNKFCFTGGIVESTRHLSMTYIHIVDITAL